MDTIIRPFDQPVEPKAEWDSPMFRLAQRQFLHAAELMGLEDNIRDRLVFPRARSSSVSRPGETNIRKARQSSDTECSTC